MPRFSLVYIIALFCFFQSFWCIELLLSLHSVEASTSPDCMFAQADASRWRPFVGAAAATQQVQFRLLLLLLLQKPRNLSRSPFAGPRAHVVGLYRAMTRSPWQLTIIACTGRPVSTRVEIRELLNKRHCDVTVVYQRISVTVGSLLQLETLWTANSCFCRTLCSWLPIIMLKRPTVDTFRQCMI